MRCSIALALLLGVSAACGDNVPTAPSAPDAAVPDGGASPCPEDCGRCGHVCTDGAMCDRGTCVTACASGVTYDVGRIVSPLGLEPWVVETADLDGDGSLDLIVADFGETIRTAFGDGHGGFSRLATYVTGYSAGSLHLGDLDGDGDVDLIAPDSSATRVYLNDGAGQLAVAEDVGSTQHTAAADVDGDGRLDLLATGSSSGIRLYRGEVGGLAAPMVVLDGVAVGPLTAGDVDDDGDVDIVYLTGTTIAVALGDGAGGFATPVHTTRGPLTPSAVRLADLIGDDVAELIVEASGTFELHAYAGSGTYGPATTLDARDLRRIADLDDDGKDDLVVADGHVCVQRGGVAGLSPRRCVTAGIAAIDVAVGDADGDGDRDLLVVSRTIGGIATMVRGLGGGALDATEVVGFTDLVPVAGADLDGVPGDEIVALSDGVVHILASSGTDVLDTLVPGSYAVYVHVADVDGGPADLVIGDFEHVFVASGLGDGTFGDPVLVRDWHAHDLRVGDVDGDGRIDLVTVEGSPARLDVSRGVGDGTFEAPISTTISAPAYATVGDLDGDGRADVVTLTDVELAIRRGSASGALAEPFVLPGTQEYDRPWLADVDGDGDLDVVADATWWRGNGDGTVGDAQPFEGVVDGLVVWVGDLDGDGDDDIVQQAYGGARLLRGGANGPVLDGAWRLDASGAAMRALIVADPDGDGEGDLVLGGDGGLEIIAGSADGFAAREVTPLPPVDALVRADLDEDSRDDLIVVTDETVRVLLSRDGGGFVESYRADGTAVAARDIDLDGHIDLVIGVDLHRGDGDGGFTAPPDPHAASRRAIVTGFLDDDVYVDVIAITADLESTRVYFGGPAGLVEGPSLPATRNACLLDLDDDARADLVDVEYDDVSTWIGRGDGTFEQQRTIAGMYSGPETPLVCATDMVASWSGDRLLTVEPRSADESLHETTLGHTPRTVDLAPIDGAPGELAVLAGGNTIYSLRDATDTLRAAGRFGGPSITGDFDGDGDLDLAVASGLGIAVFTAHCAER